MKKLIVLSLVAALLILVTPSHPVLAAGSQADTLEVTNWKGNHVGTVHRVLMNHAGNVTFIIVSLDREIKKEIAVPVAAFSSYNPENGILVLRVSEKQLASAPEFHESDLDNPAFGETIYRFFGLAPSWTEEREEQGKRM